MNNKVVIWIVVAIVVVGGGWLLLSGGNKSAQETGPIKIGVTVPLSGEAASYGESGRAGALLAQKEINDAGGVNGRQIELVFEDDTCSPTGVNAMQKLVNVDKVNAVIGPVCSAVAGAAIPIAREAGVPTIMIGASAPGLAGGPDSIFSDYASDAFQGKFAAEYVYNKLGAKKVAVLYVNNDWGSGIRGVFSKRFAELGGQVVFDEGVEQNATDMRSQVAKIKSAVPDVVYMPLYPAGAVIAVKQLKEAGVTAKIFGGDALVGDEFLKSGVSEGVMFVTGAVGNTDAFKAKIKAQTSLESPNIIAPLAYDAIKIFAKVMADKGTDAKNVIAGLNALSYKGGESFPTISFDENGDLEGATYDVQVAQGGKAVIVK
jgi:branched-chain amino acid transport system substrate-binding protein